MAQARKKAMALVGAASTHIALESQTLPEDKIAKRPVQGGAMTGSRLATYFHT